MIQKTFLCHVCWAHKRKHAFRDHTHNSKTYLFIQGSVTDEDATLHNIKQNETRQKKQRNVLIFFNNIPTAVKKYRFFKIIKTQKLSVLLHYSKSKLKGMSLYIYIKSCEFLKTFFLQSRKYVPGACWKCYSLFHFWLGFILNLMN